MTIIEEINSIRNAFEGGDEGFYSIEEKLNNFVDEIVEEEISLSPEEDEALRDLLKMYNKMKEDVESVRRQAHSEYQAAKRINPENLSAEEIIKLKR